jgi:hypothetical protein
MMGHSISHKHLSDSTVKDSDQFLSIKFNTGITAAENLGHTIQLDLKKEAHHRRGKHILQAISFSYTSNI